MSKKSDNSLLKNIAGLAGILIVFVIILRAVLAPLYLEVGQMERLQQNQLAANAGGNSGAGGGSEENFNINLGAPGGWFNWALGWVWGGPGWYRGQDYGWWGANVWNGWRNWWNGGGSNRVWNGGVNETYNREVNNEFRSDRFNNREDERLRGTGGERPRGGDEFRENREDRREGGGGSHGGESRGGRR